MDYNIYLKCENLQYTGRYKPEIVLQKSHPFFCYCYVLRRILLTVCCSVFLYKCKLFCIENMMKWTYSTKPTDFLMHNVDVILMEVVDVGSHYIWFLVTYFIFCVNINLILFLLHNEEVLFCFYEKIPSFTPSVYLLFFFHEKLCWTRYA